MPGTTVGCLGGITRFMRATASDLKLGNPFDAVVAIDKSAELSRDLKTHFGNLALAAAAYNAGPKHAANWLLGRGPLPKETREYVRSAPVTALTSDGVCKPVASASAFRSRSRAQK
jgi:soluble lytic murein transglycosylase-like protein